MKKMMKERGSLKTRFGMQAKKIKGRYRMSIKNFGIRSSAK